MNKFKINLSFNYKIVPTFFRFGIPFLGHLSVLPAGSKFDFNFVAILKGSVTVFLSITIAQLYFFSLWKMRAIFPLTVRLPNNFNFVIYRHDFQSGDRLLNEWKFVDKSFKTHQTITMDLIGLLSHETNHMEAWSLLCLFGSVLVIKQC